MKSTFCTIITADYIHYALALYESFSMFNSKLGLNILISDVIPKKTEKTFGRIMKNFPNVSIYYHEEICRDGVSKKIRSKYQDNNIDSFRWAMKPVFIKYMIEKGYDQVFFVDPDLYFFNFFDFIFEQLEGNSILISPHWRSHNPYSDERNFLLNQTNGLYNAGFIGASKSGIPAMNWWAETCLYECKIDPEKGLWDDQKYLDMMPVYFDKVKILKHKGCNIAHWNLVECERTIAPNGRVLINNQWEIVFIHFTACTINGILSGEDYLLNQFLSQYRASIEKYRNRVARSFKNRADNDLKKEPIVNRKKPKIIKNKSLFFVKKFKDSIYKIIRRYIYGNIKIFLKKSR
jgi:hypothetical protein